MSALFPNTVPEYVEGSCPICAHPLASLMGLTHGAWPGRVQLDPDCPSQPWKAQEAFGTYVTWHLRLLCAPTTNIFILLFLPILLPVTIKTQGSGNIFSQKKKPYPPDSVVTSDLSIGFWISQKLVFYHHRVLSNQLPANFRQVRYNIYRLYLVSVPVTDLTR